MKAYWGSGCIAARILDLGTRWRAVVSFTPLSLYPLYRRLGGPQSLSGRGGEEKNSQPLPGLDPPPLPDHPALNHWAIPAHLNQYFVPPGIYITFNHFMNIISRITSPWRWKQLGLATRWYLTTSLHGVTTQQDHVFNGLKSTEP
jgi:hypothetical protein